MDGHAAPLAARGHGARPVLTPGAARPAPALDQVQVWSAPLDLPPEELARMASTLCHEERRRAAAFRAALHRDRFIASRGAQRHILAGYTGVAPGRLRFVYSPEGKPALAGAGALGDLRFNVSNAGGRVLVAVTRARAVGVDLEPLGPVPDCLQLARLVFSPSERHALSGLPPDARAAAFLAAWTRKEALVKAFGFGLSAPLASFDVSLAVDESAPLLALRWPVSARGDWTIRTLPLGPGWVGAVAAEGTGWRARLATWTPPP